MNSYRLTVCDYYMSSPIRGLDVTHSEFQGTGIKQVPVIRIFGSTIDGKKACVHIHGVFPYIYIPYEGSELPDRLKYQIATSLDKSINVSLGQANASTQHVFKIILVSGIPYYGYHEKEHQFFKIYFFNPNMVKKATELLQNGVILGKVHQPHEAHVPFILQFMIDFNLQGMNLVNFSHVQHRAYLNQHYECDENSSSNDISTPDAPLRVSCCEIEVDVAASDILNRRSDVSSQSVVNPGLAALWEDEHQRRKEQGKETQPTPQSSQTREEKPSASEDFHRQRLLLKLEELTQSTDDSILTQQTDSSSIMYPAEVPEGRHFLDASFVDFHTPRKLSKIMEQCNNKNEAGPSNLENYSQSMDSQDAELLDALEELAVSQEEEEDQSVEHLDDDSILSSTSQKPLHLQDKIQQQVKEDEDDDYFEMTQPISLLLSPNVPQNISESSCDTIIAESDEENVVQSPRKLYTASQSSDEKNLSQSDVQIHDDNSHQDSNTAEENIEDIEESVEKNTNMYSMSQTSLNATLLGELLDEELWTDVDNIPNIPQFDGADDPEPSTSKGKGRRLGARGPLKPIKTLPFLSPLLNKNLSQNSSSSSEDSIKISQKSIKLNSSQDSEIHEKKSILNTFDIKLSQNSKFNSIFNSDNFDSNVSQNKNEYFNINEKIEKSSQESQIYNLSIPDTQPISQESSESFNSSLNSKNSELNMLLDVIESQEDQKSNELNTQFNNEITSSSKKKIIEFLESKSNSPSNNPPLSLGVKHIDFNKKTAQENSYITEELVTGLCNELQWPTANSGGENASFKEIIENINYFELDLPEGATAMELLEEELGQNNSSDSKSVKESTQTKNINARNKTEVSKIKIRKSTRLSLRPRVRKSLQKSVEESLNTTRNNTSSQSSDQEKRSRPQYKASTSQPRPSTSQSTPSTSGKPQVIISVENKDRGDDIIKLVPENKVPGVKNCEVTYEKSSEVRGRGCPNTKTHTFNIELDLPKKKISIDLQIAPNAIGNKKMKLSYQIENSPQKKKKGAPKKKNRYKKKSVPKETIIVMPCYVRVEKLSDEYIQNAIKTKEDSQKDNKSVPDTQPISQENDSTLEDSIDETNTKCGDYSEVQNNFDSYNSSIDSPSSFNKIIENEVTDSQNKPTSMSSKSYPEISNLREDSGNMSPKLFMDIPSSQESKNKVRLEIMSLWKDSESMSPKTLSEILKSQETGSMSSNVEVANSGENSESVSYRNLKTYSSHLINEDSAGRQLVVLKKDSVVQQMAESDSDSNKTNSQSICNPSTSQSSSNDENNIKKSTLSPRKKCLVSKLKSANKKGSKKNVSFSPLNIVIEKSPMKDATPNKNAILNEENNSERSINEDEGIEKNAPRRKLDYNSINQGSKNETIKELIVIDSDSDIIENSDDEITLLKTSYYVPNDIIAVKTIENSKNTDSDCELIGKVFPKPNCSGTNKQQGRKRKRVESTSTDSDVQMIPSPAIVSNEEASEKDSNSSASIWENNAVPVKHVPSPPESHIETQTSRKQTKIIESKKVKRYENVSESSDKVWEPLKKSQPGNSKKSKNVKNSKNGVGLPKKDPDKRKSSDLSCIIEESEDEGEFNFGITSFYDISQSELCPKKELDSSPEHKSILPSVSKDKAQNCIFEPIYNPPNYEEVITTLKENSLQEIKYQEPYYSLSSDVRNKSKEIGGRIMKLISHAACDLQEYQSSVVDTCIKTKSIKPLNNSIYIEPLFKAPTYEEVIIVKNEKIIEKTPRKDISTLRIQVPNSPGGDNSDNESLSLSPCSDVTNQSWAPISPASNSQTHSNSSLIHSTPMPKALARCMTPRRLSTQSDSCCRIDGPSPLNNTFGFRVALENLQDARAVIQPQQLTVLALELHVSTRGELRPDPDTDPIKAAFFLVSRDDGLGNQEMGVIAVQTESKTHLLSHTRSKCKLTRVNDEKSLILALLDIVKLWDPDILLGYEIEMASWGYLIQRAAYLEMNLANLLSRVQKRERGPPRPIIQQKDNNKSSHHHHAASQGVTYEASELKVTGRIILNLWRLMKHELALQSYVFENVAYHILHERAPQHSFQTLTYWWEHPSKRYHWIVTDYWLYRVEGASRLLDQLDLLGRTSELAKLFGIQFYEVLSRGSQFRVESMMLRLAKPRNFVPVSPSIMQRAHMKAPEYIPLILEPESRYYEDPVIVLDFQSLYPSIIIAYNYCFSTCLGRVEHLGQEGPFPFGCTQLKVPLKLARKISTTASISPCGVAFIKANKREGVLPRMLREILDTRLMVKKSMKENKNDATLQRVLHARQLGLKLIANVTYGYTSANFSGRMPCIEVGDSVVSKGKETLDRAIQMVTQNEAKWGARVVYGDTDSMFVLVPGRTRQQAFEIGAQIAAAVTADNPSPVKLKLEKVYHPCILQTKKRYVGYMYESPDQKEPVYEAKGIETVRRDGCPAVAKMLEKSLRFLFETQDISYVKQYVVRQYQKLLLGRSNMQDLIFAREFRGFAGYKPGACVPALELTRQWIRVDRRAEPRSGERVPYVVVNGAPGLPLIRLIRSPHDLLKDQSLRINAEYYITRAIAPALDRCFSLLGADVHQWYAEMPRRTISGLPTSTNTAGPSKPRGTISQYFATVECAACRQQTREGLCVECQSQPQKAALVLSNKLRRWERAASNIAKVCSSCCERNYDTTCCSLVCPVLFRRNQAERELEQAPFVRQLITKFLDF